MGPSAIVSAIGEHGTPRGGNAIGVEPQESPSAIHSKIVSEAVVATAPKRRRCSFRRLIFWCACDDLAYCTTSDTVVECVVLPEVPFRVSV